MKAPAPTVSVPTPTEMPSEKDCHARLAVIMSALAMDPSPNDESLQKHPLMGGMFTGFYLMKPDTTPKDALKEVWQNNYEACKEHLVPFPSKSKTIQ